MRGLKRKDEILSNPSLVASFTDAWIETKRRYRCRISVQVASFTDAWIETLTPGEIEKLNGRIFYRCVD